MNGFVQTLWQNELRPFLTELSPVADMTLRAFAYCFVLLLVGGAVAFLRELISAKIGGRPCRSLSALAHRACLMFVKRPNVPAAAPRGLYLAAPLPYNDLAEVRDRMAGENVIFYHRDEIAPAEIKPFGTAGTISDAPVTAEGGAE